MGLTYQAFTHPGAGYGSMEMMGLIESHAAPNSLCLLKGVAMLWLLFCKLLDSIRQEYLQRVCPMFQCSISQSSQHLNTFHHHFCWQVFLYLVLQEFFQTLGIVHN